VVLEREVETSLFPKIQALMEYYGKRAELQPWRVRWYALRIPSNFEINVRAALRKKIEFYLPVFREIRLWKDRRFFRDAFHPVMDSSEQRLASLERKWPLT